MMAQREVSADAAVKHFSIHVVDPDRSGGEATRTLLESGGHVVRAWTSVADFLDATPEIGSGCVVIDACASGVDTAAVHERLASPEVALPCVVVTACTDVEAAVAAMRHGAIDFLPKPPPADRLFAAIGVAEQRLSKARRRAATLRRVQTALDGLSAREREVLEGLTRGWSNKETARRLSISARTVEIHRANLMAKLEAESLSQALRIAFIAQVCGMVNPALHVD